MELNEELGFPPVTVDSPSDLSVEVGSPAGQVVIVEPGTPGPPGPGLRLDGAAKTYAELPKNLGPGDDGTSYVVQSSGLLYVWDGTAWPAEENGSPFKGDKGDQGRGVKSVALAGDALAFSMSDNSTESVTVPQIKAASDSAARAAESASQAKAAQDNVAASKDAAANSATVATGASSAAAASEKAAKDSASAAKVSEAAAAVSATAAKVSEQTAAGASEKAKADADAAAASRTAAAVAEANAGTARDTATAKATESSVNATTAADQAKAASADASRANDAATRAENAVNTGIADASSTVKGGVRLPGAEPGQLGGTWDEPTVTGWEKKADLVGGKIPSSQIPSIATHERAVVNTAAERLALTADKVQPGDVCIQIGNPGRGTYFLQDVDPSKEASWVLQVAPTDAVTSVNGYNGAVTLNKSDLNLANVDNTSDANKPISTAVQNALNAKASSSWKITAGTGLTGGGDASADRNLGVDFGTGAGKVVQGNDARLSDQRVPTDGSVTSAKIADGTIVNADIAANADISMAKLGFGRLWVKSIESGTTYDVRATMFFLSQADYDALSTKDPYAVYVIVAR